MKNGYCLYDSFNNVIISRHRTIEAAAKAEAKKPHYLCATRELVDGEAKRLTDSDTDYLCNCLAFNTKQNPVFN